MQAAGGDSAAPAASQIVGARASAHSHIGAGRRVCEAQDSEVQSPYDVTLQCYCIHRPNYRRHFMKDIEATLQAPPTRGAPLAPVRRSSTPKAPSRAAR